MIHNEKCSNVAEKFSEQSTPKPVIHLWGKFTNTRSA